MLKRKIFVIALSTMVSATTVLPGIESVAAASKTNNHKAKSGYATMKEDAQKKGDKLEKPKENGDYTLTFNVTDRKTGKPMPMVQNALDGYAKLSVDGDKMKVTLLNNKLANEMIDMSVGMDENNLPKAEKKPFGKPSATGKYDGYEYTMPIENLGEKHIIAALVKVMGGTEKQKYDWSKYRKSHITFTSLQKGWTGYGSSMTIEQALTRALIARGYDKDGDKTISDQEIKDISGKLDLSSCHLSDISRLSLLTNKVTELDIANNEIEVLPENLLSGLDKLDKFIADGNLLTELPKNFFKDNKNLTWISIAANKIKNVDGSDFKGLSKVWNFDLGNNEISKIDGKLLQDMHSLKKLSIASNNLSTVPDDLLNPVKDTLEFVSFNYNRLTKLPKTIQQATKLTNVQLHSNNITDISGVDFGKLKGLKELQLMKNSIKSLPNKVFANNKELISVDLHDNQLKSVSADVLPKYALMHKFDLSLNNIVAIDPKLSKKIKAWCKLYPQKSTLALKIDSYKKGTLKWKQKFDLLNLRYWYDETVDNYKKELTTISEYDEMLKIANLNRKNIVKIMKGDRREWVITTKLQKKTGRGDFVTVSQKKESNIGDKMSGSFAVKGKGTYRIVKILDITINGSLSRGMEAISKEYKINNKPAVKKPEVKSFKVKKLSKRRVKLTWRKVKNAKSYIIYRSVKGKFKKIKTLKGSTTKFIDKKLKKGRTYSYKIMVKAKVGKKIISGKYSKTKRVRVK